MPRNEILKVNLAMPQTWQSHCIEYAESLTMSSNKTKDAGWFTRGELEQQKGFEEASRHIEAGKYEVDMDSDGEEIYKKVQKREVESEEHRRSLTASSSTRRVNQEQVDKICSEL